MNETFGSYIARVISEGESVNPDELQEIMRKQAESMGFRARVNLQVECPECLKKTKLDELKVFGGICEDCNSQK